jgi:hypothetical protein
MELKIKEVIEQIKLLNEGDFDAVNNIIDEQDVNPETKTLANSNRRIMTLLTQLYWQIKQEKNNFLKYGTKMV